MCVYMYTLLGVDVLVHVLCSCVCVLLFCFVFQSPPVFEGSSIPATSRCLPLINLLITVISDSFHHYRFRATHCLPLYTTGPGGNFTHAHTHNHTHTGKRREAWLLITHSSTFTPAVRHPSPCRWGERKNRGVRQRKE